MLIVIVRAVIIVVTAFSNYVICIDNHCDDYYKEWSVINISASGGAIMTVISH